MKKIMIKGENRTLIDLNDKCPICGTARKDMSFTFTMFTNEATSNCCNALFQIGEYHIDNPTEEEKQLLADLRGDFIEFKIKEEWIEPLKQSISEIGIADLDNDDVVEKAKEIMMDWV